MKLKKLPGKIFNVINTHNLIKPHDAIIVGVSGGPDSVALIKTLYSINSGKNLHLHLFVAHLDHQLRGKFSDEDAQFVQNLSKELSLPFIFKGVDIKKISAQMNRSIEETARLERYTFFMESSRKYNASVVAVGHTADDNTETLLHRIIRGTGLRGLGGIPMKRPLTPGFPVQLVRPLLNIWRSEIIEYLEKEPTAYRTDASNYEPKYLRNKIRCELIPLLEKQYNPNVKKALSHLGNILTANNEYLSLEAKKILKSCTVEITGDSYILNTRFLTKQPMILQHLVLQEILSTLQVPLKEVCYEHYTKILDEINKTGRVWHFHLPGKLSLWHEDNMLHLQKKFLPVICTVPSLPFGEITVQIPGTTPVDSLGQFVSEILDVRHVSVEAFKKTKTKDEEIFDLQSITMPITVRGRKRGDAISPLGISGRKKLKDLFIDKKVPSELRNTIPIVVMNNQPIWVVGMCIDNRVKVTPRTEKILKLAFQRCMKR